MFVFSLFQTPIERNLKPSKSRSQSRMATNDFIHICGVLRSLKQTSKPTIKKTLVKCDEILRNFREWTKTEIEYVQDPSKVKSTNKATSKASASKAGRSVSFPVGKKYAGRKKANFFNKFNNSKVVNTAIDTPKVPDKLRARSFSKDAVEGHKSRSQLELLNMQSELTAKCDVFFQSSEAVKETSKRKSFTEMLETGGVNAKKLKTRLSSDNTLVGSDSSSHCQDRTLGEKDGHVTNEVLMSPVSSIQVSLNTQDVKSETFLERLSAYGVESTSSKSGNQSTALENPPKDCLNSYLISPKCLPQLEATYAIIIPKNSNVTPDGCNISDKIAYLENQANRISNMGQCSSQYKTPIRFHSSNSSNEVSSDPDKLNPSTADCHIIKKKNITSYLSAKTAEHTFVMMNPEKPMQETTGMQLRKLRERPIVMLKEIKPVAKRTKRTRTETAEEEIESKLKRREESMKQQKLDLQLKAEERKQRREERMRKTKEAREKLEKERLEKVQNSGGKKRQQVDNTKEVENKKRMRTRQTTKQNTEKKTAVTLKVSKKRKSSTVAITRSQRLKRSLATVKEDETEEEVSNTPPKVPQCLPKKGKSKNTRQTAKIKGRNASGMPKNTATQETDLSKSSSTKPTPLDTTTLQPASSTFVCNTTFTAETSPPANEEIIPIENKGTPCPSSKVTPVSTNPSTPAVSSKEFATPFKKPAVTPLPTPKQSSSSKKKDGSARQESSIANYEITPYRDEDEDSNDDEEIRKPFPNWASGIRLKEAVIKQSYHPPNIDKLFGPLKRTVNLTDIFGRHHRKYRKRTSSAVWQNISFGLDESMNRSNRSIVLRS